MRSRRNRKYRKIEVVDNRVNLVNIKIENPICNLNKIRRAIKNNRVIKINKIKPKEKLMGKRLYKIWKMKTHTTRKINKQKK